MGKTTAKKGDEKKLGNAIEEALMEAYMSGDLNDYSHDDVEFAGAKTHVAKTEIGEDGLGGDASSMGGGGKKSSLKISGVRKEDGSDCCGGGCCEVGDKKKAPAIFSKKQYLEIGPSKVN